MFRCKVFNIADIEPVSLEGEETFGQVETDEPSASFLGGLFDEQDMNRRRVRTSSVEEVGREEGQPLKRSREDGNIASLLAGIADKIINPLVQHRQDLGLAELVTALKTSKKSEPRRENPEEPKKIQLRDFDQEEDDAVTTFAHEARNALRPFCTQPKDYWGGVRRCVSPRMEQAYTSHISPTATNPRTVYKMGDLGEELSLKWFLYENITATRYATK